MIEYILFFFSSYDLFCISSDVPAILRIKNNNISNNSFLIITVPPIKAKGTDPNK